MKYLVLVVFAALAFGCAGDKEFLAATEAQRAVAIHASTTQKEMALIASGQAHEQELARIKARADIAIERERRMAEEAKSNTVRFGAMIKIAEKADAGGRVAIARSLEEKAQPVSTVSMEREPAPPQIVMPQIAMPVFQLPKNPIDRWISAGEKILVPLLGIARDVALGVNGQRAAVRIAESRDRAETEQNRDTMGSITSIVRSGNESNTASVQTIGQIVAGLPPTIQINGNGNGVGGSIVDNSVKPISIVQITTNCNRTTNNTSPGGNTGGETSGAGPGGTNNDGGALECPAENSKRK